MAIKQAEDRIMRSIYSEIRFDTPGLFDLLLTADNTDNTNSTWVRGHAQDYILEYFRLLADRRKHTHSDHMDHIHSQAWYHYNAPPHPQQIADAQAALKRGIDEDWQASVQRYPEVLEYFFGLVDLTLPSDDDPAVRDPPLSALSGQHRKGSRRVTGPVSTHDGPPAIAASGYSHMINGMPPRTPPPMDRHERRTPAPREKRAARHSLPPQHPQHAPYNFSHSHAPYM